MLRTTNAGTTNHGDDEWQGQQGQQTAGTTGTDDTGTMNDGDDKRRDDE